MIADKEARARAIKAGRVFDFKTHACHAQNVAEEPALRFIVFARINEDREQHQKAANRKEVKNARDPKNHAPNNEIDSFHREAVSRQPSAISWMSNAS